MRKILYVFFIVCLTGFLGGCSNSGGKEVPEMESIVKELDKNEIKYYVFTNSQDNQFIVVPEFGARILAVSVGGENLFWTHPDILEGQGGQRSWISPEGGPKGFLFKPDWSGNRDFSMMDPGHYKVTFFEENEHLVLENEFEATSNDGIEKYKLTITRDIGLKEDPLKDAPEFNGLNYEFLGFKDSFRNEKELPCQDFYIQGFP